MRLYEICFSPVGGTEKVTDFLAEEWECEKVKVDLTDPDMDFSKYEFEREDICLAAVPSYGGRVPVTAVERIKKLRGNGASAVLVCVYGNRAYEDTLLELENSLLESGFHCAAAVAAVAEHSIMHQFATGRPDKEDREELHRFAGKIKEALSQSAPGTERGGEKNREAVPVPGERPYKEYHGVPFKPQPDKNCIRCGICAAKCPVKAIKSEAGFAADKELCISCMRCVAVCPQHARDLNKAVLFAASQTMKKACSGRKKNELFL